MKRFIALPIAVFSGLYLLIMGPMFGPVDPLPIIDEALALMVFVQAMAALGVDVRRWLPFFGKKPPPVPVRAEARHRTVDV